MEKMVLNENELAKRWGLSPKTLQRWRSEGRGPRYLKLSKRVGYLISEILEFESQAMYSATWESESEAGSIDAAGLGSGIEIATPRRIPRITREEFSSGQYVQSLQRRYYHPARPRT